MNSQSGYFPMPPRFRTRVVRRMQLAACALVCALPVPLRAQILGLPVLQNGFAQPGLAGGVNVGGGDGLSTYAVAGAWGRQGGGYGVVGGVGVVRADGDTHLTGGARLLWAFGIGESGSLSAAPFIGVGGTRQNDVASADTAANGTREQVSATLISVPVGVGLGYRRVVAGRAASVFATPSYQFWRASASGVDASTEGYVRFALGADVAVTPRIGLTVGWETGAKADAGAGPTSSLFGVGASYAF